MSTTHCVSSWPRTIAPVHPFPARMDPLEVVAKLPDIRCGKLRVLDPMMGSGTIPLLAAIAGHTGIGVDIDPLALLISRVAGRTLDALRVTHAAQRVVKRASQSSRVQFQHEDEETQAFIDYWFDPVAQARLGAIVRAIQQEDEKLRDALLCAFSRLIITKDAGASRARDVAHSRPHVVREAASFDPIERFPLAVQNLLSRHITLGPGRPPGRALRMEKGNAKRLPIKTGSIDLVLTSPPYLQAIDYMRGHRLSLVWMGYSLAVLRQINADSVGATAPVQDGYQSIVRAASGGALPKAKQRTLVRYCSDMDSVISEIARVLRVGGQATLVVATATLAGTPIRLSTVVRHLAIARGLEPIERRVRKLPPSRRYLPPPGAGTGSLDRRMRREWFLTYQKVAQTS